MRKRIKIIKSELVASPNKEKQQVLKAAHQMELNGHVLTRPSKLRNAATWFVSGVKGYDAHLTVGEGTL